MSLYLGGLFGPCCVDLGSSIYCALTEILSIFFHYREERERERERKKEREKERVYESEQLGLYQSLH